MKKIGIWAPLVTTAVVLAAAGLVWSGGPGVALGAERGSGGFEGSGNERITIDFYEADLPHVLQFLSVSSGEEIRLSPGVAPGIKITMGVVDLTWSQALDRVMGEHGLAMVRRGDVYWVVAAEQAPGVGGGTMVAGAHSSPSPDYGVPHPLFPEEEVEIEPDPDPVAPPEAVVDSSKGVLLEAVFAKVSKGTGSGGGGFLDGRSLDSQGGKASKGLHMWLQMLGEGGQVEVLGNHSMETLNGQTVSFVQQVGLETVSGETSPSGPMVLKLDVTPTVQANSSINLGVKVSRELGRLGAVGSVTETMLIVQNGDAVYVGGIHAVKGEKRGDDSWTSGIPFIGSLFGAGPAGQNDYEIVLLISSKITDQA